MQVGVSVNYFKENKQLTHTKTNSYSFIEKDIW